MVVGIKPAIAIPILQFLLLSGCGKPIVAYTNRRIHIWDIMSYDPAASRVLVRNLRRRDSVWLTTTEFRQRFQLLVYSAL